MQVDVEQLINYEYEHRLVGQHGRGVNKTIDSRIKHKKVVYIVKNEKSVVLETDSIHDAVTKFNNL